MPTLEQLNHMAVDTILPEISGTLLSCMKYSAKEDPEYGHTSFQPAQMKLDSGETVACVFKNHNDVTPLKGKHITLKSVSGDHGMTGVKIGDYKNATQIIVTATGQIFQGGEGRGAAPAGRGQSAGRGTPPVRGTVAPLSASQPRYTLEELLMLWETITSDSRIEQLEDAGVEQDAASTVFIAATREGIKAPVAPPAQRPAPAAEAQRPPAEPESQVPPNYEDPQIPF